MSTKKPPKRLNMINTITKFCMLKYASIGSRNSVAECCIHIAKVASSNLAATTMNINLKKIIFAIIWLGFISLGPITVIQNTNFAAVAANPALIVNLFQRITGLMAFSMLFSQIILGFFMIKLTEKLGGWVFKFHIFEGILTYILVFIHPLLFLVFKYIVFHSSDIFYIFTDFCVLCKPQAELFYTLGRVSFWIITATVLAGLFRTATPWLRNNWKKVHFLNYLAFILIGIHSLGVGTDIGTPPFSYFHGPALVIVAGIIIYKLFKFVKTYLQA